MFYLFLLFDIFSTVIEFLCQWDFLCISSVWIWKTHKISPFGLIFLRTRSTNKILDWYFKKWLPSQYPVTLTVTTENKWSAILIFLWIWLLHYIWLWELVISGYFWNLSVFTVDYDRLKCGSLWIYLSWSWSSWSWYLWVWALILFYGFGKKISSTHSLEIYFLYHFSDNLNIYTLDLHHNRRFWRGNFLPTSQIN